MWAVYTDFLYVILIRAPLRVPSHHKPTLPSHAQAPTVTRGCLNSGFWSGETRGSLAGRWSTSGLGDFLWSSALGSFSARRDPPTPAGVVLVATPIRRVAPRMSKYFSRFRRWGRKR